MESIPEEFVPLKNFFLILLAEAAKKSMLVLILLGELKGLELKGTCPKRAQPCFTSCS